MMESNIIAICALGVTIIGALIVAVIYISTQLDKKMSVVDFDHEHRELMGRVRDLELWAAKRSFPGK